MLLRLSQGWMGGKKKREMAITVLIIFYFCERSVCVVLCVIKFTVTSLLLVLQARKTVCVMHPYS